MKKALISLFVLSLLICTLLATSVSAATIVESGSCGDNVTYTLDSDGLLTISGTGVMGNYGYYSVPWYSSRSSVKSVVIKNGVTSIGNSAFYDCDSLTSIEIPDSVTSIGGGAFYYCSSLTSIEIPDSVTSIGNSAFSYCSKLTSVEIGDSVTSIGDSAFYNCSSLTSIKIPEGVTSIGYDAFYNTGYYNNSSNWENGALYIGKALIGTKTSLSVSYSVKADTRVIGCSAFEGCSDLIMVELGVNVTSIGNSAFNGCTNLTFINLPDSVTSIGERVFYYCTSLTSVEIPEGVTSIGDYAFEYCTSLTSIEIPDSVTSIGDYAFEYCTSLTSIEIPEGVTSIGNYTFRDCTSLTSIEIPDGVTSIGSSAFEYCKSLTSVEIGDCVTSIGEEAFWMCSSLKSVEIPDSVTSIGEHAFDLCYSLENVYITDLKAWCNISFGSSDANPLYYSNSGASLYLNGEKITELVIPEGIETVKPYTFCGLDGASIVRLPAGLKTVQANAFADMYDLTDVYVPSTATMIAGSAFNNSTLNIHGFLNTYAERFANLKGYNFIPLDEVTYTVTYNANGGSYAITSQQKGHYGSYTIPTSVPTRVGCEFMGWSLERDGEVVYRAGDSMTRNADTELFAVWKIASVTVSGGKASLGRSVSIPVSISDNQGVNSIKLTLNYDRTALELISVENGEVLTELEDVNVDSDSPIILITNALEDSNLNGTLFTLNFKAKETASLGDYEITFSYNSYDVINIDCDEIPIKMTSGKITVMECIPGDANGDDAVNMKDSLLLRKFLAGWEVDVDEGALDVNADGIVNMKDALILRKFLAGWNVELG